MIRHPKNCNLDFFYLFIDFNLSSKLNKIKHNEKSSNSFKNNKPDSSALAKHALEKNHQFDFKEYKVLGHKADYASKSSVK